jgi:uncharacterized protein (DUF58 family)
MFFGSRRAMKSVVAAELAALTAWRTLRVGDRVGGIVFNEAELVEIRPKRNQTVALRLLHEVVRFNQALAADELAHGDVTLNRVLEAALRRAAHDHLVVLISDLDGADNETQRLATLLAAHNDVLVVLTYDPLGASLVGQPGMIATDRGSRWQIPAGSDFADAFRQVFARKLDEWTEIFRALRVPVIPVSTAEPVAEQLRTLFGEHLAR